MFLKENFKWGGALEGMEGRCRPLGPPASSVSCRSVSAAFVSALGAAPRVLSNLALESNGKMHDNQLIFYKGETGFSKKHGKSTRGAVPLQNRSFGTPRNGYRVETATYSQFYE